MAAWTKRNGKDDINNAHFRQSAAESELMPAAATRRECLHHGTGRAGQTHQRATCDPLHGVVDISTACDSYNSKRSPYSRIRTMFDEATRTRSAVRNVT